MSAFIDHLLAIGYVLAQLNGTLPHWRIKHPEIRRKASLEWTHSAFDVLGDFIMNVRMRSEKAQANPVYTPEAEFLRLKKRREHLSIEALADKGMDVTAEGKVYLPDDFENPFDNAA